MKHPSKIFFFLFLNLYLLPVFTAEIDKIDVTNHPLNSFPSINVSIGDKSIEYYGMDSSLEDDLRFIKQETKLAGEVSFSGYIFAKEFVESFRLPNLVANKKRSSEFIKVFTEKDPNKLAKYLMEVNEKWRTSKTDVEYQKVAKAIELAKSPEDAESTLFFPMGYVELKSPKNNDERYFIKLSDINKTNVQMNASLTKVRLLKSITVYSFQNVLSGLNFGDIEKDSPEDKLYKKLESINLSLCGVDCPLQATADLGSLALNVGKIVSFEVVGNEKIEDLDDFNKYVLAQQWCLLNNFSQGCKEPALEKEVKELSLHPVIKALLTKHKSAVELCKFLQK